MTDGRPVKFPDYHDCPKRIDSLWTLRKGKLGHSEITRLQVAEGGA